MNRLNHRWVLSPQFLASSLPPRLGVESSGKLLFLWKGILSLGWTGRNNNETINGSSGQVVYFESRNRELKMGTGTPKDKDEVNRRDVWECDGWVCVFEVIDSSSRFELVRKSSTLVRVLTTFCFQVCWEHRAVWWKTKNLRWGMYTPRIHWVTRGTGTPKDRDEVNRR
jgi:hypothetical protein